MITYKNTILPSTKVNVRRRENTRRVFAKENHSLLDAKYLSANFNEFRKPPLRHECRALTIPKK